MQHESFLKHYFRVKKTGRKVPPPPRQSNCVVWRHRLRALWYKKAPFNMDVSAKLNNAGKSQWSGERISSALTRQMSTVDRTTPLILMQCESVSRRSLLNITAIKAKCQFPLARSEVSGSFRALVFLSLFNTDRTANLINPGAGVGSKQHFWPG